MWWAMWWAMWWWAAAWWPMSPEQLYHMLEWQINMILNKYAINQQIQRINKIRMDIWNKNIIRKLNQNILKWFEQEIKYAAWIWKKAHNEVTRLLKKYWQAPNWNDV